MIRSDHLTICSGDLGVIEMITHQSFGFPPCCVPGAPVSLLFILPPTRWNIQYGLQETVSMLVSHLSVVFKQRANQVGESPLPADHYSMVFLLTSLWQKRGCSAYPGTHKKIYFITSRANHKAEVCVCDWKRRSSLSYHGSCAPPVLEIRHKSLLCKCIPEIFKDHNLF